MARYLTAGKRDRRREEQLSADSGRMHQKAMPPESEHGRRHGRPKEVSLDKEADSFFDLDALKLMGLGAKVQEASEIIEIIENLPEDLRRVLVYVWEGYSNAEIAEKLENCGLYAVRMKLERTRRRLQRLRTRASSDPSR